ncbi:MAG: hypothetical protein EXR72_11960 [Myxococcales bacterium]|nr:hypothetical protein [Myxococcales bacterium]
MATLGLAAPSVGGLRPAVAAGGGRVAVAWLELGERSRILVAVLDATRPGAELVAPAAEAAIGWSGLSSPRLVVADDGFVLAFGGRDPAEREAIALVQVSRDGTVGAPSTAVVAEGGPRPLAILRTPETLLVGWSAWAVDVPTVNLTGAGRAGPSPSPPRVLDTAPHEPALQLLPGGTRAGSEAEAVRPRGRMATGAHPGGWHDVRAVWVAVAGTGVEARDVVRGVTLDGRGAARGEAFEAGEGRFPSLVRLADGDLLMMERAEKLWLGRVAASGVVTPLPAPAGRVGSLAARADAGIACYGRPAATADGDEIHCGQLDGEGRSSGEVAVAGGVVGLEGLGLASDGDLAAVAWQQDDELAGSAVDVALVRCR